jgi:hypothetical protein
MIGEQGGLSMRPMKTNLRWGIRWVIMILIIVAVIAFAFLGKSRPPILQ